MNSSERGAQKCIGYTAEGDYFDCPNDAGTPWTPLWCPECDERRRSRLSGQFADLAVRNGLDPSDYGLEAP